VCVCMYVCKYVSYSIKKIKNWENLPIPVNGMKSTLSG